MSIYKSHKYVRFFMLTYFVGLCLQCQAPKESVETIRVSLLVNEKHTWYQAFKYFEEILEERSKGRIDVQVFPSEQLAKEVEAIRLIQADIIEMTVTSSLLSNWIEIAAFCEMPFLLRDSTDMKNLIKGKLGQQIEKEMVEKTGLRPVAYFQRGPRHLTSNRPIKHPDELNGLILRVPNVPSFVTAWEAMGAKPTPMAFSEVFTSLQQGTVEAQENPFDLILTSSFSEVQKYINLTSHVMSWGYIVIGEKQFQQLPADLQAIFLQAAKDMQAYEHSLFLDSERKIQDQLKAQGMELIEVDKNAFQERCGDAIYNSLSPAMQEVYRDYLENREASTE